MIKVIGTGACGNKAVIDLIANGVISRKDALLVNSTFKDISAGYDDIFVKIGDGRGGCGKETKLAEEMCAKSFESKVLDSALDGLLEPGVDTILIVNSTEGGTGCGSAPIIAKYYKEIYNLNIHIVAFTGFEDDPRVLGNTVTYFQNLREDYVIEIISNKKFLKEANGNIMRAHKLANEELVRRAKVLLGQTIVDSDQNIDETDLFKVDTTPGYMTIESVVIDKSIKNQEQLNKLILDTIDSTKSVDIENPGCKRMAIILNVSDRIKDIVDFQFEVLKNKFGVPFEIFKHVQFEGDTEFINIIVSGMRMPIDEIRDIYKKYKDAESKINKSKDDFFSSVKSLGCDSDMFDSARNSDISNSILDKKKMFMNGNVVPTSEQLQVEEKAFIVKKNAFINSIK